jgi:hypothetical protein
MAFTSVADHLQQTVQLRKTGLKSAKFIRCPSSLPKLAGTQSA